MPNYAVTYQALNADSRKQAFVAQFNRESGEDAIRACKYLYEKMPGFELLSVCLMK